MPSSTVHRTDAVTTDAAETFAIELMRHRSNLRGLARLLAGDRSDADDLVQDTIEHALRASSRFKPGTNMNAWLRRIMRNLFTDSCRHGSRVRSLSAQEIDLLSASDPQPVSCLDLISIEDVMGAVASLKPLHREAFDLACVSRLSYRAIAARLRIPMSTVGTRLRRAKDQLRRVLQTQWCRSTPMQAAGVGVPGSRVSSANDNDDDLMPSGPFAPRPRGPARQRL
jgi:RNA polymerase sigma-70 factor (ECF subfamily)